MIFRHKRIAAILLICMCSLIFTSCSASEKNTTGTLKVGVRGNVANFGLYDEDSDTYYGMDIDLANMLAEELSYSDVEFVKVTPETREKVLESGEVDCVIACYTITDERKKIVDFSPEYYSDDTVVMAEKSSLITEVSDLQNAKIGCIKNSTSRAAVEKLLPSQYNVTFKEFEDADEMVAELEYGKIDAMVEDRSLCLGYMTEDRIIIDYSFEKQPFGVATKKGSMLSPKIEAAIVKFRKNGFLDEIAEKWQ